MTAVNRIIGFDLSKINTYEGNLITSERKFPKITSQEIKDPSVVHVRPFQSANKCPKR